MRKKSRIWIISAVMTLILFILTASMYTQLMYGTLPSGWGGFAVGIALVTFFGLLLIASVLSFVITVVYATGLYKIGLIISVVVAVLVLLTIPAVFLIMIPHIAVGIWGMKQ